MLLIIDVIKSMGKLIFFFMLNSEKMNNKKIRIRQVIGSKVSKILKSELTFSFIDKIDTKALTYKTGENLTS